MGTNLSDEGQWGDFFRLICVNNYCNSILYSVYIISWANYNNTANKVTILDNETAKCGARTIFSS